MQQLLLALTGLLIQEKWPYAFKTASDNIILCRQITPQNYQLS
jgi:hypothetical protein